MARKTTRGRASGQVSVPAATSRGGSDVAALGSMVAGGVDDTGVLVTRLSRLCALAEQTGRTERAVVSPGGCESPQFWRRGPLSGLRVDDWHARAARTPRSAASRPGPDGPGLDGSASGLGVLPERVAAARRVLAAAEAPGALGGMDADALLGVVEAGETIAAHATAVGLAATRVLHAKVAEQVTGGAVNLADLSRSRREQLAAEARSVTVEEIAAATGLGVGECWRRTRFALSPVGRSGRARSMLWRGECSWQRAEAVVERTGCLSPDVADQIAADVLGPGRDGTPRSWQQFTGRLRRLVVRHRDPDEAADEHAQSMRQRGAWAQLHEDGTGSFTFTGDAPIITAAMARVDEIARRFKRAGDPRTLDQLRADVTADLIMRGIIGPADTGTEAETGTGREPGAGADHEVRDRWGRYGRLGELPPARVDVIIPLSVLLGSDDAVAELPGHGPIPAFLARQIATAPGSVWARLVTDPLTGRAVERSIQRYQPDAVMREQIRARDHTSRAPGSVATAEHTDADHVIPYDHDNPDRGGPTSETNLVCLDRRHHRFKTRGYWTAHLQHDTDELVWTTLTGRRYATTPMDYHDLTATSGRPGAGDTSAGSASAQWERAEQKAAGRCFDISDGDLVDTGAAAVRRRRDRAGASQRACPRCRANHDQDRGPCPYHQALVPRSRSESLPISADPPQRRAAPQPLIVDDTPPPF